MRNYIRRHTIGVLGGLLSTSWCVHLYLLLNAAKVGDELHMRYELAVVILHELGVAALVAYSRLRPRTRKD